MMGSIQQKQYSQAYVLLEWQAHLDACVPLHDGLYQITKQAAHKRQHLQQQRQHQQQHPAALSNSSHR
jgi:hypothetical protein